jgi:UDP-N-acetylglucosamine diphosphorylase / glucose-1-phosphate thymidylyltransferase / UDP-N-acetylgalactosamine diphosphorylase / glucosamine-1-phosphate N-acetyltransferase / galactosamine-1-phosphate N-acetyltransferase
MRVCLFEDQAAARLNPLVLTRPVFDLLCGQDSLAEKQFRYFQAYDRGAIVRDYLADLCRLQAPALRVNNRAWLRAGPLVLVNGRWLPPASGGRREPWASWPGDGLPGPSVGLVGDEIAYVVLNAREAARMQLEDLDLCLAEWKNGLPRHEAGGHVVRFPWNLVEWNASQLGCDYDQKRSATGMNLQALAITLIGPAESLSVAPSARIDPFVVVDVTGGPVTIGERVVVEAFSRLEGPCYIGPRSRILGARIRGGTTVGPDCRVGGEVECTIIQGYSNKYHDGFLGHSYLGEWVNFGAGTQCSDLRNDYRQVSVAVDGEFLSSGLTKIGCFVGDHTKTGLGTLINTGTSVGAFCNLLPGNRLLPRYFPSFTNWWMNDYGENSNLDCLLETAALVMRRRDRLFTEVHADLFRHLFRDLQPERSHFLQQARGNTWRRSA